MTPELIAQLAQLGMGGVALYLTIRLNLRVDRVVNGHDQQERRLVKIEKKLHIEPTPHFNRLEPDRA